MPDPPRRRSPVLLVLVGLAVGAWAGFALEDFGSDLAVVVLSMAVGALVALSVQTRRRLDALARRLADAEHDQRARADAALVVSPARPDTSERAPGTAPTRPEPAQAPRLPAQPSDRPARPAPPRKPALPPELDAALRRAWAFASGGNPIVRVALVVLFVGFGVGIRYAAQLGLFPVEARLAAAGLAGLGLVGLGWWLRETSAAFALAVQGGGVALLYLTVYAAYALVGLLGAPVALAWMAAVALFGGVLAVVQDAPGLAFLGALGGFAAPVVASTGGASHVLLFSYYLALGLGIGALAWRRGWRSLAVLGVVGTFGIGGWWGGLEYRPELYATTQPFVIAFFVLYFALALRLAWLDLRTDPAPTERDLAVDGTLLFGLPAATFVLQQGLVEGLRFGSAWSAGALAAVYLGAWALVRRRQAPRLLSDALLAVGLAFATLATPLAFNRVVTGALWSLQAAALVWTGARQDKLWMRLAGIALSVGAAAVLFLGGVLDADRAFTPETLTGWIVAVSLALSAFVLSRMREAQAWERTAGRLLLAGGVLWWGLTAATHADTLAQDAFVPAATLGVLGLSAALFATAGHALAWTDLRRAALLAGPVAAAGALAEAARVLFGHGRPSPLDDAGWLGWAILLGSTVYALARNRTDAERSQGATFALSVWSAVWVASLALTALPPAAWGGGWQMLGFAAPLTAALAALAWRGSDTALAPVSTPRGRVVTGAGLALATAIAALAASCVPGGAAPLATLPLVSPTDLSVAALLASLVAWIARREALSAPVAWGLGALALVAIGGVVARGAHHLAGVPFQPGALFDAAAFQAPLAVAWAVLALVLTVTASRRGSRSRWTAGVIVLALVVVKLFAVDLSRADALVRVGAFLAVGALMLWIGYRSPLPPRAGAPDPEETDERLAAARRDAPDTVGAGEESPGA